jgi:PhzF family phenazine biosynthesis protein
MHKYSFPQLDVFTDTAFCGNFLGAIGSYGFTCETAEENSQIHARFYAPDAGTAEDTATGNPARSISGYLVYHRTIKINKFTIEPGHFMKRSGRIFAKIEGKK